MNCNSYYFRNRERILQQAKEYREIIKLYRKHRLEYFKYFNDVKVKEDFDEYFKEHHLKDKKLQDIQVDYNILFD